VERGQEDLDRSHAAAEEKPKAHWPEPLSAEAFQGLAGELVRKIEPQTEADEAAVLLQILVSFGALVGRGPHVRVEGDEHHPNLFALIVGDTAKARKGTSWGRVKEPFSKIISPIGESSAASWPRVVDGLSSGEGLKWTVRDQTTKMEADGATVTEVEVDPGVHDKRILVVESEFARSCGNAHERGNTLSSTIGRRDSGNLQT
jgi:hypothetical protein